MPCGCANNKDLSDKVLNLEIMKNLSIDEIISLYRQGYTLEGVNINSELDVPNISRINTLTYNNQCSGTPEVAFNNASVLLGTFGAVRQGRVWAQRFYGNFRCLDTVQFNMRRIANVNFYIEIRKDDGAGEPLGIPLVDDSGLILRTSSIPYTDIPTSPGWVYPFIGAILPTDWFYWICFVPADFYDSPIYRDIAHDRFWLQDGTNIADKRSAVFENGGWINSSTFAFAVLKTPTFSNCTTMGNVVANPTTALVGDSISLSAQASPTGIYTIQFYDTITNTVLASDTATVAKTTYSALWTSSTAGVYQVKARVVGQCESPGTTSVTINCTPAVVSGVTASPTTVYIGQPVTLTSMVTPSGAYTVQFIKTDGTVLASDTSSTSKMTYSAIWTPSVAGIYDIRAKTSTQALSCANQPIRTVTVNLAPANITAMAITTAPSAPCIQGTCTVNVNVTWQNIGGTIGSFVPNISIDGTPSPAPYPSEPVGAGLTVIHTFVVSGLTKIGSPHTICPVPN